MARVFLPAMLREMVGGRTEVQVPGHTVGELVQQLERMIPGLSARLVDGGSLRPNLAVAVDGEVSPLGLLETVAEDSEVHFVLAVSGG